MEFIRRGWNKFSKYTIFEGGDGSQFGFWHDVLCEEQPLKVSFPELFSIAFSRDAFVLDLPLYNGFPQWNVNFVRVAHD